MDNKFDRFFQDLSIADESNAMDIDEFVTVDRHFLDIDSLVELKNVNYGKVRIKDRAVFYDNKLYDYLGNTTGDDETFEVYFNESDIKNVIIDLNAKGGKSL